MKRLTEAGMRRLTLSEATDLVVSMYDGLSAHSIRELKLERNHDVLHALSVRQLILDSLTFELTTRNVLPVTLNTLSKIFSQVYCRYKL